jgi:hypothetical protein
MMEEWEKQKGRQDLHDQLDQECFYSSYRTNHPENPVNLPEVYLPLAGR